MNNDHIGRIKFIAGRQKGSSIPGAILSLFAEAFVWNPFYPLLLAARVIILTLQPLPGVFLPALIVEALLSGADFERVFGLALWLAGSVLVLSLLEIWSGRKLAVLQSGFKDELNARLSQKRMRLSLEQIESVKVRELFERADNAVSGDFNYAVRSLGGLRGADAIGNETVNLLAGACKAAILLLFLARLGIVPAIAILVVLLLHMAGGKREKRAAYEERIKTTPYRNKNQYVTNIMIDFRYAKEIRLYGLQEFLLGKFRENKEHFYEARREARPAFLFSHILATLAEILQLGATYGYLAYRVLFCGMGLGEFTGHSAAVNQLASTLVFMVQAWLNLILYGEYFVDYKRALCLEEGEAALAEQKTEAAREKEGEGKLVFEEVSFRYPGMAAKALDRVSFTLPLKGSVSVVGRNGSGKSTMMKLLLRLYRPQEGRILLDGRDIWEMPLAEYRTRVAAVFQDFAVFALPVRENVAPRGEEEKVRESLEQAGLWETVRKLPGGADAPLFRKYYPEGVDLSGGEKQKLAIARMLYGNAPVMVLDEPTAALDPRSEVEIYEQIHRLSGGRLVLYISHRMSSCHFSDLVVVLDKGRLQELGSHRELMEHKGLYYEMHQAQAEGYRDWG